MLRFLAPALLGLLLAACIPPRISGRQCERISGKALLPLFGQEYTLDALEAAILEVHGVASQDLQRRQDEAIWVIDWEKGGVSYSAGLRGSELIFVNQRFEKGAITAQQLVACLGEPEQYQAWYDAYPAFSYSSLGLSLMFLERGMVAYGMRHLPGGLAAPPAVDAGFPIDMVSLFGHGWEESENAFGNARPWPGAWDGLEIQVFEHE